MEIILFMESPGISNQNIYLGTSGWFYDEWKGIVYPSNIAQKDMFRYYSAVFRTAEINSTFYQIPSLKTVSGWAKNCPDYFKFSAKIPDLVTHKSKMDFDEYINPLSTFISNMMPLIDENKMLAFLLQLPPKFGDNKEGDLKKLDRFVQYWNDTIKNQISSKNNGATPELVVEFRNLNWITDDTFSYLRQNSINYCSVIEPTLPPRFEITHNLFYLRFHGFGKKIWFNYNFSEDELDDWTKKIKPLLDQIRTNQEATGKLKAAIYFNNHFSGYAVKNAISFASKNNITLQKSLKDLGLPIQELIKDPNNKDNVSNNSKRKQFKLDDFLI